MNRRKRHFIISHVKKRTAMCQNLKDCNQTISPKEPNWEGSNFYLMPGPLISPNPLFFRFMANPSRFKQYNWEPINVICSCHLKIRLCVKKVSDSLWLCHRVQGPIWCQRTMAASMRLCTREGHKDRPRCGAQIAGENGKSPNSPCLKHRDSSCSPEEDMD